MSEELRNYEPGWKEQIAAWMSRNITGDTREGYRNAQSAVDAGQVLTAPTPAGWAGTSYDMARGLGDAVRKYMETPSAPSGSKIDIPTAEKRMQEIDSRMKELDAMKLANGLNKKLSKERTTELNGQYEEEKKTLASEREKAIGDISSTRQLMKWGEAPFRERYPGATLAATVGSIPAAALLSRGVANKVTGGVERAVTAANTARDAGNPAKYVEQLQAAETLAGRAPYKIGAGAAGAALVPAEMQMMPDLLDYKTMPKDSRAYKESAQQFGSWQDYLKGQAIPLVGGVAGSATGIAKSKMMGSTAAAEARAMSSGMTGNYADDVKAAGKQINSQRKVDQALQKSDQAQQLNSAATAAAVQRLDDPSTMTPEMARALLARQMGQQAALPPPQSVIPAHQAAGGASRRVPYSLTSPEQDELKAALAQILMNKQ